jgi:predicted nucleotidyltransferase
VAKVELIAQALGPVCDRLVFVGGCAVDLLLTDPAASAPRVTYDVDLLVEVAALPGYHSLEKEFFQLGFKRDVSQDAPICRWLFRDLQVDLMPTDSRILGFANRWYPMVAATAKEVRLPSGSSIRLITAPTFIATKFEAFADRGRSDLLGSHDLEDIVNVVEGRPEVVGEATASPTALQDYLGAQCAALLAMPNFMDVLPGMIFPDELLAARVKNVAHRLQ